MFSDNERPERIKLILVAASVVILASASFTYGQQGTREIVSTDFTNNRPAGTKSSESLSGTLGGRLTKRIPKPRVYRPRPNLGTAAPEVSRPKRPARVGESIAHLGVTIWRLRPARPTDTGTRQLLREKSGATEWIPERIEADAMIRAGDRVRLSIESPRTGYLYIVNRDEYADGRSGAMNLIFPLAGEDNRVYAGRLIDIPSPESSMKASPAANQSGEVLSIIVSNTQLNLPLSDEVLPITRAQLTQWERSWGGYTEAWELDGGAGEGWTLAERHAAAKTGARQLTRDDPPPQTIYRVSKADNQAMLVNVRLRYEK